MLQSRSLTRLFNTFVCTRYCQTLQHLLRMSSRVFCARDRHLRSQNCATLK